MIDRNPPWECQRCKATKTQVRGEDKFMAFRDQKYELVRQRACEECGAEMFIKRK